MRRTMLMSCAALMAAGCMEQRPVEPSASDTARLNAALAGYEMIGPATACVSSRDLRGNRSFGEGVILFDGPTSSTLYVNRPEAGCPELGNGRALVTRSPSDRLCRGDIAEVFDTATRTSFGSCSLGDFILYRRVKR